jgi:hypothetical protein
LHYAYSSAGAPMSVTSSLRVLKQFRLLDGSLPLWRAWAGSDLTVVKTER